MITWFFVGLLAGGMLGMLLMALLASAAHADDVAELKAKVDHCEKNHPRVWNPSEFWWNQSPTSYTTDSES